MDKDTISLKPLGVGTLTVLNRILMEVSMHHEDG
jgi:hypothetical protein